MDSLVVRRSQAKSGTTQRAAVTTPGGEQVVVAVRIPPGVRDKKVIRLSREQLPKGYAWPPGGPLVQVRVRDRRIGHLLAALSLLAGIIADAWPVTLLIPLIWAVVAHCAEYARKHAVDSIDPKVTRRFRALLRYHLASSAVLYLVPIGAAIACYLYLAAYIALFRHTMTVRQLLALQRWFLRISNFFDNRIELSNADVLYLLAGVYLVSCLLLSRRGGDRRRNSVQDRVRRARRAAVDAVRSLVATYCRFSGPLGAALATLASLTFLATAISAEGTQIRLKAVADQTAYVHAAAKVRAQLSNRIVALLYPKVHGAMPSDYRHVLSSLSSIDAQITEASGRAEDDGHLYGVSSAKGKALIRQEQERRQRVAALPHDWVADAPAQRRSEPAAPRNLTDEQAAAARDYAATGSEDDRVEILSEERKDVYLQAETIVSAPLGDALKNLTAHVPLAGPLVDALMDATDSVAQDKLTEAAGLITERVVRRSGDIKAAINAAAARIVAAVDVPTAARGVAARARTLAAEWRQKPGSARRVADGLDREAVDRTVHDLTGTNSHAQDAAVDRVSDDSDEARQRAIVEELFSIKDTASGSTRVEAARSIVELQPKLPTLISQKQARAAGEIVGYYYVYHWIYI